MSSKVRSLFEIPKELNCDSSTVKISITGQFILSLQENGNLSIYSFSSKSVVFTDKDAKSADWI